jgi:hypothetical protein
VIAEGSASGLQAAAAGELSLAVNLRKEMSFEIARALQERGVADLVASGYATSVSTAP